MSKFDALFKKIEVFEKLAVYGDRSSFLRAIAQEANTGGLSAQQKTLLYQAQRLLQGAGAESAAIGNALLPLSGKPADMNAVVRDINNALMTGKLSPLSDEYKQLQALKGQIQASAAPPKDPGEGEPPMMMPADRITGYAPIARDQQEALSRYVTIKGLGLPLQIDGRLGPETRNAMNAAKAQLAKENKSVKSDNELLMAVKDEAAKLNNRTEVA